MLGVVLSSRTSAMYFFFISSSIVCVYYSNNSGPLSSRLTRALSCLEAKRKFFWQVGFVFL